MERYKVIENDTPSEPAGAYAHFEVTDAQKKDAEGNGPASICQCWSKEDAELICRCVQYLDDLEHQVP